MVKNIVIVGGAGDMITVAVRAFLKYDHDIHLTIVDFDQTKLDQRLAEHDAGDRVDYRQGDLFDSNRMNELITGADLVINAAGPYYKTALPVIEVCQEQRITYCDFNDEPDASMETIARHEQVKAAGIGVYIGLGASPGITNIWVKELIEELDEAEEVDTAWCTGDEGAVPYGRAVIAHAVRIFGGDAEFDTWDQGQLVKRPSFVNGELMPFAEPLGDYMVYELSHPEPLTVSHYYPSLRRVRNLGGLHPQPQNGLFRGLSQAVCRGELSLDEVIDFVQAVIVGKLGSLRCWKHGWRGMREQVRKGDVASGEFWSYLWNGVRNKYYDFFGGIVVRVKGIKDGRPVTLIRRTARSGPGTFFTNMAAVTGTPLAALSRMVLDGQTAEEHRLGVYSPEAWVHAPTFYQYMDHYGVPESDVFEPIIRVNTDG